MTTEAYLRAQAPGYPIDADVLNFAMLSPALAKPTKFRAISASDIVEDNIDCEAYIKALKYATSTILYSIAGVITSGSVSEQVGDIHATRTSTALTQSERDLLRNRANELRREIGAELESNASDVSGMTDGSAYRIHSNLRHKPTWH